MPVYSYRYSSCGVFTHLLNFSTVYLYLVNLDLKPMAESPVIGTFYHILVSYKKKNTRLFFRISEEWVNSKGRIPAYGIRPSVRWIRNIAP